MSSASRWDALVLGVGGMGAAALAHLARRGLSVVGIEQDDVPSERGSSVGETRVIRKAYFEDPRYVPLLERAYVLWRELEVVACETLFVRSGCVTIGPPDHPAIRGVMESVTRHALPHQRLVESELRSRFPALVPSPGDVGVFERDAGYLHVERCTRAHAQWATTLGAELRTRAVVEDIRFDGEVHVTLSDGARLTAPRAVVAAGAWLSSSPAFAEIARSVPLSVERQVQLWFPSSPLARALPSFIHFVGDRAFYGIPTADSVKVCAHHGGGLTTPDRLDRTLRPEDEAAVRGYLRAHAPSLDAAPLRFRVCMYTNTPDQHFVVGLAPHRPRVVLLGGFSGHGYKAAPALGEIAAQLATEGRCDLEIGMFAPGRFDPARAS